MTRSLLLLEEPTDAFSPGMEERLELRSEYDDYDYQPRRRRRSAPVRVSDKVNRNSSFLSAAWLAVGSRLLWSYTTKPKDEPPKTAKYETEKCTMPRHTSLNEKQDDTLKSAMRHTPNRGKLRVAFADATERWTESAEYLERRAQCLEPDANEEEMTTDETSTEVNA